MISKGRNKILQTI